MALNPWLDSTVLKIIRAHTNSVEESKLDNAAITRLAFFTCPFGVF